MDSKLQIISGNFKGRKLRVPASARPTQNRARIALFNILDSLGVRPRVTWDAFAGSGAFGLEILSRFPDATVYFTDTDENTVRIIRENLDALGVKARATAICADAMGVLHKYASDADLIFLDPPYADAATGHELVARLADVARAGTIVVWEQDAAVAVTPDEQNWEILRDRQYGRARFLILRRK